MPFISPQMLSPKRGAPDGKTSSLPVAPISTPEESSLVETTAEKRISLPTPEKDHDWVYDISSDISISSQGTEMAVNKVGINR